MLDDFFAELEAEIAVSAAKTKVKADREAAKKAANNPHLNSAARQRASAEFRELSKLLEAEEWTIVSTVALFTEQQCDGCGSVHRVFLQYMERQSMVRKLSTQRYVRTPRPQPGTALETLIQPHRTHICADCCEDHGFAVSSANYLHPADTVANLSTTYTQEDINAPSE